MKWFGTVAEMKLVVLISISWYLRQVLGLEQRSQLVVGEVVGSRSKLKLLRLLLLLRKVSFSWSSLDF